MLNASVSIISPLQEELGIKRYCIFVWRTGDTALVAEQADLLDERIIPYNLAKSSRSSVEVIWEKENFLFLTHHVSSSFSLSVWQVVVLIFYFTGLANNELDSNYEYLRTTFCGLADFVSNFFLLSLTSTCNSLTVNCMASDKVSSFQSESHFCVYPRSVQRPEGTRLLILVEVRQCLEMRNPVRMKETSVDERYCYLQWDNTYGNDTSNVSNAWSESETFLISFIHMTSRLENDSPRCRPSVNFRLAEKSLMLERSFSQISVDSVSSAELFVVEDENIPIRFLSRFCFDLRCRAKSHNACQAECHLVFRKLQSKGETRLSLERSSLTSEAVWTPCLKANSRCLPVVRSARFGALRRSICYCSAC